MPVIMVLRSPLYSLYLEYSEFKFCFRKSHQDFRTFIEHYEQLKRKIDGDILSTCSQIQIRIFDLLAVSNLSCDDDVQNIVESLENIKEVNDIYETVKDSIQMIADANTLQVKEEEQFGKDYPKPLDFNQEHDNDNTLHDDGTEDEKFTVIKFTRDGKDLHDDDEGKPGKIIGRSKGFKKKIPNGSNDYDDDCVLPSHFNSVENTANRTENASGEDTDLKRERLYERNKKKIGELVLASPDNSKFNCKVCGNVFKHRRDCRRHISHFHIDGKKIRKFKCRTCKIEFCNLEEYRNHKKSVHPIKNTWNHLVQCTECDKQVLKRSLRDHMMSHFKMPCPHCGKMVSERYLNKHIAEHEQIGSEHYYHCDQCDFKTKRPEGVKQHYDNIHAPKDYPCDICGEPHATEATLRNHVRRVHEKNKMVNCPYCSKPFGGAYLPYHIEQLHKGPVSTVCAFCSFETTDRINLEEHMRQQHPYEVVPKMSVNKEYFCNLCDHVTGSSSSMAMHKKIKHLGIIEKCDECDFTAPSKAKVKYHKEKVHMGIRHPCTYCEFQATTKSGIRAHMIRTHPEFKLYSCHLCSYRTENKELLQRHVQNHGKRKN